MALTQAFYCSPTVAAQKGYTLTKSYTLSTQEAVELRDLYESYELGQNYSIAAISIIFGAAIKATALIIGFGLSVLTAQTIFGDFFEQLDNQFGEVATAGVQFTKIEATYTYVRHGSNDGAYFLSSIKAK